MGMKSDHIMLICSGTAKAGPPTITPYCGGYEDYALLEHREFPWLGSPLYLEIPLDKLDTQNQRVGGR